MFSFLTVFYSSDWLVTRFIAEGDFELLDLLGFNVPSTGITGTDHCAHFV